MAILWKLSKKILGNADEIKSYDGLNFVNHFYKNVNLTVENNVATCITTKNADVATFKGIRQGDSAEKVFAEYGNHYQTNTEAAGNFSDWKCSQCGATQHKAGQSSPFVSGCKVSADGKHIWFKI